MSSSTAAREYHQIEDRRITNLDEQPASAARDSDSGASRREEVAGTIPAVAAAVAAAAPSSVAAGVVAAAASVDSRASAWRQRTAVACRLEEAPTAEKPSMILQDRSRKTTQ